MSADAAPRVRYEKKDHVALVTLNRPGVLNAMDLRMHKELGEVWDDVEADDEVRVAVLTGTGQRSFSVGQDLRERARLDELGAPPSTFGSRDQPGWPRFTERFTVSKPVIARVNGYALGGGFELALACDIVVAAEHAVFALPEVRLGLVPGAGGAFRLPRQLPLVRSRPRRPCGWGWSTTSSRHANWTAVWPAGRTTSSGPPRCRYGPSRNASCGPSTCRSKRRSRPGTSGRRDVAGVGTRSKDHGPSRNGAIRCGADIERHFGRCE